MIRIQYWISIDEIGMGKRVMLQLGFNTFGFQLTMLERALVHAQFKIYISTFDSLKMRGLLRHLNAVDSERRPHGSAQ